MSEFQEYISIVEKNGWTVVGMDDDTLILRRKKDPNPLLVLLAVFAIPVLIGILFLILLYAVRGEETIVVSLDEARAYVAQHRLDRTAREEAKRMADEKYAARYPRLSRVVSRSSAPYALIGTLAAIVWVLAVLLAG